MSYEAKGTLVATPGTTTTTPQTAHCPLPYSLRFSVPALRTNTSSPLRPSAQPHSSHAHCAFNMPTAPPPSTSTRLLLVVCAGDASLHHHSAKPWLTPAASSRRYDVAVLYYGKNGAMAHRYQKGTVFFARSAGPKWALLRTFLLEQKPLWSQYEYIGFPDDDLSITPTQWDRLVDCADEHRLDVFQPAILPPPRDKSDTVEKRLSDPAYCERFLSHTRGTRHRLQ
jgi:hypothetical protein